MVKTSHGPTKSSSSASSKTRMPIFSVMECPEAPIPGHHLRAKALQLERGSERLCHANPAALREGIREADKQGQNKQTQRNLVERIEQGCPVRADHVVQ